MSLCEIMCLLGMQKVSFNFPPAENLPACRFALKGQCHEVYVLLQPGCILEVKLKEIRYMYSIWWWSLLLQKVTVLLTVIYLISPEGGVLV